MEIEEIRKLNALLIIKNKCNNNKAFFASKIGKSPSYVSRWFSNGKQSRNIDSETSRHIEKEFGLNSGWMDKLQDIIRVIMSEDHLRNQLIDFYDQLSAESKHKLVNMANTLLRDEKDIESTKAAPFPHKEKQ